jgi:hypothetical protein
LENVGLEKWEDSAKSLKLRGVYQLVSNERAIAPVISAKN